MEIAAPELMVALLFLAALVQWATERLFGKFVNGESMVWISGAMGVAICIIFQIDVLKQLGFVSAHGEYPGEIVTGIIISGGANVVHDLLDKLGILPKATA